MEHRNITTIKQAYEHKKGDRLWQDNREKAIDFRLLICNRKKLKKTGAATGKRRKKSLFFRKKMEAKFILSDYNKAIKTKRKTEKETSFHIQNNSEQIRNEGFMMTAVMTLLLLILPCVGMIPAHMAARLSYTEDEFDYLTF
ncbi:MAG: hypothetical protein Q4C40_05710 [Eubacteriales bacterium]|nr:hypothetical protein [Eubacteriales bacterium]